MYVFYVKKGKLSTKYPCYSLLAEALNYDAIIIILIYFLQK